MLTYVSMSVLPLMVPTCEKIYLLSPLSVFWCCPHTWKRLELWKTSLFEAWVPPAGCWVKETASNLRLGTCLARCAPTIHPSGLQVVKVPSTPAFFTSPHLQSEALMDGLAPEFSVTECLLPVEKEMVSGRLLSVGNPKQTNVISIY